MSVEFKSYQDAARYARAEANRLGVSFGIEKSTRHQGWTVKMIPRPENRQGFETRCEVVDPERPR